MNKKSTIRKTVILTMMGFVLVAVGMIVASCVGAKTISLTTVYNSIFHYQEELDLILVRDSRLPRAICSALVGGFLAVSGGVMQGITRNPVAEPTVLGMSQGATLAVAICTVCFGVSSGSTVIFFAMLGAVISGGFILLISFKSSFYGNLSVLLLAGTASATFTISLASTVALLGNRSQELAFWVAGGLGNSSWEEVWILAVYGVIPVILLFFLAGRIHLLKLGEEVSVGLGIQPGKVRIFSVALMIPICATSVAVAGNISFVGLVIPHILQRIIGNDDRILFPMSFLYGSVLLVWADILAKMVHLPYETPIGLFTAMIGVPFYLALVRKEKNG